MPRIMISNNNKFKQTPLHKASIKGLLSVVEYLVSHGADINTVNSKINQ